MFSSVVSFSHEPAGRATSTKEKNQRIRRHCLEITYWQVLIVWYELYEQSDRPFTCLLRSLTHLS